MEAPTHASPPVTAFNKVQSRTPDPSPVRWVRTLGLVIAAGVGLWLTFTWIRGAPPAEESDLLFRMSIAAAEFRPATQVRDGDEASAWVFEQYGWPVVIPDLPDLQLVGAGETSLTRESTAPPLESTWVTPTFKYVGLGSETVVLYAYDYAQLDRASEWLALPQGVFARLAEEIPFDTRRLDQTGDYAITWRRRAVVFTALTNSEAVVERLTGVLSVPVQP
ncbi:MAG: hypothetical protein AAF170_17710 [Bacteroidota bacterium]